MSGPLSRSPAICPTKTQFATVGNLELGRGAKQPAMQRTSMNRGERAQTATSMGPNEHNYRGLLPAQSHEAQHLEQHLCANLRRGGGRVVLRRHFDHIAADDVDALEPAQERHDFPRH